MRPELGLQDASPADYSCWAGAGAFLSTPSDLVRLGAAMLKPGLLKPETIALIQAPFRLESGASTDYAMGWKLEDVRLVGQRTRLLGHRGNPTGGSVSLLAFPDRALVVAAAANVSHAKGVDLFAREVAEAFATQASGENVR